VFLIEARTGRVRRLETGAGNARGPDWSPDGRRLVFESNRTGTYKLYRLTVPTAEFPAPAASPGDTCEPVVDLAFDGADGAAVPDLTGKGNAAQVVGTVAWRDGHAVFGAGGHLTIPSPQGVDFGQSTFSVSATVRVAEHTGELRLIAVGDYPDSRRGWQFFLHPENVLWFNARAPDNRFVGARSDQPLPTGRDVRIAGVRRADGRVELYVDGFLQKRAGAGATRAYGAASQIRLGSQFDNTSPFAGEIAGFGVYSGTVSVAGDREKALSAFFDGGKRP